MLHELLANVTTAVALLHVSTEQQRIILPQRHFHFPQNMLFTNASFQVANEALGIGCLLNPFTPESSNPKRKVKV